MNLEIERLDRNRVRLLEWHLAGFVVFFLFSIIRFFLRASGLNSAPIGLVVLILSVLGVAVVAGSTSGLALINRRLKLEPALGEALNNDYIRSIERSSWRAAYLGSVASTAFFAVVSFLYPIEDPVLVALNSIITGAGAYQLNFYLQYKNA